MNYLLLATLTLDTPGMNLTEPMEVLKEALSSADPETEVNRLGEGNDWDWISASLDEEESVHNSRKHALQHYEKSSIFEDTTLCLTLRGTLHEIIGLCNEVIRLGATDALNDWVADTGAALSTEYSEPADD